ncbi:translation initiation factor eIF2 assembly protein-like [Diachasmimorpha longicaudata]|uniref:translation initiation factor eIF2 assembly protein-like n=1 Tax=Diachasmimorpha longicaudata TaxID=58733 RepID=UPI0030B8B3BA
MVNTLKSECSICTWYPNFAKVSIESRVLVIPDEVSQYLEHDAFVLPSEAVGKPVENGEWTDGSAVDDSGEEAEVQPSFPEFSKQIQEVIDEFGAVFVKANWRTPLDATWVAPTKTLKCTSLEEVYLLLKSSDRISGDINTVKQLSCESGGLKCCLVLKRWRDINPSSEFRCFVVNRQLMGICQRDSSQFHPYIETDKYNIQRDITSLFNEKIKDKFKLDNYTFDVIRIKKDKVKIVDFGPLDETSTKGTLFTYSELHDSITDPPEFRFIAEDMGIQPNTSHHFCVPQEINEFFRTGNDSMMDIIRREVENQRLE